MNKREKTNRRQFLKGKSVVNAIQDSDVGTAGLSGDGTSGASSTPSAHLLKFSRRAMACQFEFFLSGDAAGQDVDEAMAALDLVDVLEDQLTVYRDTSEICRLNRTASARAVAVEPRLFELLCRAKQIYADTDGAFDISAGPLSKVWGFFRRDGQIPGGKDLDAALQYVGSRHLQLDAQRYEVRFGLSQMEVNLGGIGKGYALDRAGELLQNAGVERFLLHGGQSSVIAAGNRNGDELSDSGWSVGIRHPQRPDRRLIEVRLQNRALGTSGAANQYFHHHGKRYGHVLDPRTGWPVEGLLSATAITSGAADADALSTAFHVMGLKQTAEYCAQRPDVAAILIAPAEAGEVDIEVFNLERDQYRIVACS